MQRNRGGDIFSRISGGDKNMSSLSPKSSFRGQPHPMSGPKKDNTGNYIAGAKLAGNVLTSDKAKEMYGSGKEYAKGIFDKVADTKVSQGTEGSALGATGAETTGATGGANLGGGMAASGIGALGASGGAATGAAAGTGAVGAGGASAASMGSGATTAIAPSAGGAGGAAASGASAMPWGAAAGVGGSLLASQYEDPQAQAQISGASQGAAMGSVAGPWGMLVGAAIGNELARGEGNILDDPAEWAKNQLTMKSFASDMKGLTKGIF